MSSLEEILINFNGKPFKPFNADGCFTKEGRIVYADFCSLLYDLQTIVPNFNAEEIEKELDLIVEFEK